MRSAPVIVLVAVLTLCGCVGGGTPAPLIEISDNLYLVPSYMFIHEVALIFEMERVPAPDEQLRVVVLRGGPGENYGAGYIDQPFEEHHRFSFDQGFFHVGNYRYPAARHSQLHILRERTGDLTLTFRGRKITFKNSGTWKPAVMYREVRKTGKLPEDHLHVGPHHVVSRPGENRVEINGQPVLVGPGGSLTIDRRGWVDSSG